jgi:hypothetical protein
VRIIVDVSGLPLPLITTWWEKRRGDKFLWILGTIKNGLPIPPDHNMVTSSGKEVGAVNSYGS